MNDRALLLPIAIFIVLSQFDEYTLAVNLFYQPLIIFINGKNFY